MSFSGFDLRQKEIEQGHIPLDASFDSSDDGNTTVESYSSSDDDRPIAITDNALPSDLLTTLDSITNTLTSDENNEIQKHYRLILLESIIQNYIDELTILTDKRKLFNFLNPGDQLIISELKAILQSVQNPDETNVKSILKKARTRLYYFPSFYQAEDDNATDVINSLSSINNKQKSACPILKSEIDSAQKSINDVFDKINEINNSTLTTEASKNNEKRKNHLEILRNNINEIEIKKYNLKLIIELTHIINSSNIDNIKIPTMSDDNIKKDILKIHEWAKNTETKKNGVISTEKLDAIKTALLTDINLNNTQFLTTLQANINKIIQASKPTWFEYIFGYKSSPLAQALQTSTILRLNSKVYNRQKLKPLNATKSRIVEQPILNQLRKAISSIKQSVDNVATRISRNIKNATTQEIENKHIRDKNLASENNSPKTYRRESHCTHFPKEPFLRETFPGEKPNSMKAQEENFQTVKNEFIKGNNFTFADYSRFATAFAEKLRWLGEEGKLIHELDTLADITSKPGMYVTIQDLESLNKAIRTIQELEKTQVQSVKLQ